jgi:hypothetical protein
LTAARIDSRDLAYILTLVRKYLCSLAILALAWAGISCSRIASGDPVLARVNNAAITVREFSAVAPAGTEDTAADLAKRQGLLDQMISQKLFVARALELGYGETLAGSLEKKKAGMLRSHLERYVRNQKVTPADIAQESTLMVNEVHLKLIEVGTYDTAMTVAMLLKQGVPFDSLATRYNRAGFTGPDGDLGFAPLARTPSEVMQGVRNLQLGQSTSMLVRSSIYYDFVELVGRRTIPPESIPNLHALAERQAGQRKSSEFLRRIRDQVSYDEEVLDYFTRRLDSLQPVDSARVVARRKDGYKVRIGSLLPVIRSYGAVYPAARRKALKEDIENDVLEREAGRLGLDKTSEFRNEFQRMLDGGIYQYFYAQQITARATPTDPQVATFYETHPDKYPGQSLEQVADQIRAELTAERKPQLYSELLNQLRSKARITIDQKLLAQIRK